MVVFIREKVLVFSFWRQEHWSRNWRKYISFRVKINLQKIFVIFSNMICIDIKVNKRENMRAIDNVVFLLLSIKTNRSLTNRSVKKRPKLKIQYMQKNKIKI